VANKQIMGNYFPIRSSIFITSVFLMISFSLISQVTIINQPFASTNPVGWTTDASSWTLNASYASDHTSNGYCASIIDGKASKFIYIPISITSGNTYNISFWTKRIGTTTVYINETADQTTPLYSNNGSVTSDNNWRQTTCTSWVSTYTGSVYIEIAYTGNTYGGSPAYLDDIFVTETVPTCTFPTVQGSINSFTAVGESQLTINWTRGDGNNCMIIAKAAASVLSTPVDGATYTDNTIFGSGSQIGTGNFVVYKGTGTSAIITNLEPGITYNFYIYEFNTTGPCYLRPGGTASQATIATTNYYVNDNILSGDIFATAVGNNSNHGKLPSKPKLTLKNLLSSVTLNPGDTVFIDAGTYTNEENINFSSSGVTFTGAGSNKTIIDDQLAGASTNYFMYVTGSNITFREMTIKGYENNGTQTPGHSGQALTIGDGATGILIENVMMSSNGASGGNPSISILDNCSVTIRGGGGVCNTWHTAYTGGIEAYGNGITLNLENYVMAYNFKTASYDGGGLLIIGNNTTTVNVTNCRFYNNEASDGGAISQRGGILNVTDCVIEGNLAGQSGTPIYGGGARMTGGTATYTDCVFKSNTLGSAGGTLRGGGIGIYSLDRPVNLTIDHCQFEGNTASEGKDIYADVYSGNGVTVSITNTTFSNPATNSIYNKDATITVSNSGNPSVAGTNIPAVNFLNTSLPPAPPTPSPTGIVAGDCSTTITLPVKLTEFFGKCVDNKNALFWQTATEINNDYFLLERSADGIIFEPAGQITGRGNSSSPVNYTYSDENSSEKYKYYRLKQFDFDGTESVSQLIYIQDYCNNDSGNLSSIQFDQENSEINILVFSETESQVTVSISDILGRKIFSDNYLIIEGYNNLQHRLDNMPKTVYIISVYNNDFSIQKKIILNNGQR